MTFLRCWCGHPDRHAMLLLMLITALPARAGVRQLAANARPSGALALNNAGQAAWWDHGLNLWDGSAARRLTQGEGGSLQDPSQLSDSGQIVWQEVSGSDYTVNLWDGTRARVLAQYARSVEPPRVNAAGRAVWEGDGQIYLWDGAQVRLLSGGATLNETPRINGAGQAVWEGDGQIYLWDGSTVQRLTRPLPGHAFTNAAPQINASGQAAWAGALDKQGSNAYFWDGLDAWRLTQHGGGVRAPLLNDAGQIIWAQTDSSGQPQELDLWDGTRIRAIQPAGSGLPFYFHDQINARGQVVWDGQRPEDNSIRVFLWENGTARDLAGHPVSDPLPELGEGGEVVWRDRQDGSSELFVWDGRSVRQISNSRGRGAATTVNLWFSPVNQAGQVAWSDGSGVYLYTPPVPGSLELEPGTLLEGRTALGTVTLPQPASPGGAVVMLASDNPAVTVPATVALPAGTTSATFPVRTTVLPRAGSATISATASGDTWTAALAITHTALASVGLEAGALTVMLDGPAPPGGAVVTVTSDHPEALQLAGDGPGGPSGTVTTTIAAGYDRATLVYWTRPVPVPTAVHMSVTYGGVTRVTTLSLSPPD